MLLTDSVNFFKQLYEKLSIVNESAGNIVFEKIKYVNKKNGFNTL
jgi:hypothetical protein